MVSSCLKKLYLYIKLCCSRHGLSRRFYSCKIQGDYKLCERLHKCIVKKVIATRNYARVQIKFVIYSLQWYASIFCIAVTFLPINLSNRSHPL